MRRNSQPKTVFSIVPACLAILACLFFKSISHAQVTDADPINNGPYANGTNNLVGTNNNSSVVGNLEILGLNQGITFDFTGTPGGTAQWAQGLAFSDAGFNGGGGFNDNDVIRVQSKNTNSVTNSVDYNIAFSGDVFGLQFSMDGFDNGDFTTITFYRDGSLVPVTTSVITPDTGVVVGSAGSGVTVYRSNNSNGNEGFTIALPLGTAVDEVRFIDTRKANNSSGSASTNNDNVTVYFYDFKWDVPDDAIVANDDAYLAPVDSSVGATGIFNVLDNNGSGADTLGGTGATTGDVSISAVGTLPTGVTLNSNGDVDVSSAVSEGIISFEYEICDLTYTDLCDTATVTFTAVDMSDTGLPATAQVCTASTPTFTGGASGTISDGTYTANYAASTTQSGYASVNYFTAGQSLVVNPQAATSVNPDVYSVTYTLSSITSASQVIRIYGGRQLPSIGGGDNQAGTYTFSWTGGTGNASYYDPATPSASMYRFAPPAGFDINQGQIFGTDTSGGIANGGSIGTFDVYNASNEWYVELPAGATAVTVTKTTYANGDGNGQGLDYRFPLLDNGTGSNGGESFQEWITFTTVLCESSLDYSDAPTASYGGANHVINNSVTLGPSVTAETADYNDTNAAGDVDNGVTLPSFVQSQAATISVSVNGAGGYLQAWVDWDGASGFGGGEKIANDVQDGGAGDADGVANGTIELAVTVPAAATTSQTFARFRWSTDTGLGSTGSASDGEVEDYALTVIAGNPGLTLAKVATYGAGPTTANGTSDNLPVGTVVTYTYTVTNSGNQTITNISIADVHDGFGADPVPNPDGATLTDNGTLGDSDNSTTGDSLWDALGPGDVITMTANYTVVQQDIDELQ